MRLRTGQSINLPSVPPQHVQSSSVRVPQTGRLKPGNAHSSSAKEERYLFESEVGLERPETQTSLYAIAQNHVVYTTNLA